MRGVRPGGPGGRRAGQGRRVRRRLARRFRREAQPSENDLPDGAGRDRRGDDRRAGPAADAGRHHHRRRELPLPGRHRPRAAAARSGNALRRHGHQRRRVGARPRLLPDDWRREGGRRAARSDLQDAVARSGTDRADTGPRGPAEHRRAWLPALRSRGRGALCEDDPQRNRVRAHGGVRRGSQHPETRQRRQGKPRERRRDRAAQAPGALSIRFRFGGCDRAVAAGKRRHARGCSI